MVGLPLQIRRIPGRMSEPVTASDDQGNSTSPRKRLAVPLLLVTCFASCMWPELGLWTLGDEFFTWVGFVAFSMLMFCLHYVRKPERYPPLGLWAIALFLGSAVGLDLALLRYPSGSQLFLVGTPLLKLFALGACYFVALPMALADRRNKQLRWAPRIAVATAVSALPVVCVVGFLVFQYKGFSGK